MSSTGWDGPDAGGQGGPSGPTQGSPQGRPQGTPGQAGMPLTPPAWQPAPPTAPTHQAGRPAGTGAPGGPGHGTTPGMASAPHYGSPAGVPGYPSPAGPGAQGYGPGGQGYGPGGQGHGPGGPAGPGGPTDPSGPTGPGGPGGPTGPGGPGGPGGWGPSPQGTPPPKKKPWALIAVALACVAALVLVVGGGVTAYVLTQRDDPSPTASGPETTDPTGTAPDEPAETEDPTEEPTEDPTPSAAEGSGFEVIPPYDVPPGDVEDLTAIMGDNPLTSGSLPAVSDCELPATPVGPTAEQLTAVLTAAKSCLDPIWTTASSDRGLPWTSPDVVVYTYPDVPTSAVCDPETFDADFPRMCNLDSTIYWPLDYGTANELSEDANVPGTYLWDLAYMYLSAASWNSSLGIYYGQLDTLLEESGDEDLRSETWRRYSLQMQCLASATSMQVPSSAEPTKALRDQLTDPASWSEGEPPRNISPEARTHWLEVGFESGGDLAACNTWTADAADVT